MADKAPPGSTPSSPARSERNGRNEEPTPRRRQTSRTPSMRMVSQHSRAFAELPNLCRGFHEFHLSTNVAMSTRARHRPRSLCRTRSTTIAPPGPTPSPSPSRSKGELKQTLTNRVALAACLLCQPRRALLTPRCAVVAGSVMSCTCGTCWTRRWRVHVPSCWSCSTCPSAPSITDR